MRKSKKFSLLFDIFLAALYNNSNRKTRINAVRKGPTVGGQQKNQTEPRRRMVTHELLTPFSFIRAEPNGLQNVVKLPFLA